MKHPPTTSHNYLPMVLALGSLLPAGANVRADIDVRHDQWCDIYIGEFCNCEPNVTLRAPNTPRREHRPKQAGE